MKNFILIFCCIAFLMAPAFSQQNEEAKEEESLGNEVEEALSGAAKKIESLFNKKSKKNRSEEAEEEAPESREEREMSSEEEDEAAEQAAANILNGIFGGDSDEEYVPTTNEFIGQFTMQMDMFKNGKPDKHNPMIMDLNFAKTKTGIVMNNMKGKSARMIMDLTDNTMIMVTEDGGSSQAFKMKRPNTSKVVNEAMKGYEVEKTGEYRNIDGYRCQKVIINDTKEETVTTAWITQDLDVDWRKVTESLMAGRVDTNMDALRALEGFTIESETIEKGGKERYTMKMSKIKIGSYDQAVFDTTGLEVMSMPGFGG